MHESVPKTRNGFFVWLVGYILILWPCTGILALCLRTFFIQGNKKCRERDQMNRECGWMGSCVSWSETISHSRPCVLAHCRDEANTLHFANPPWLWDSFYPRNSWSNVPTHPIHPILLPTTFFLCPWMNKVNKGKRFADIEEVTKKTPESLKYSTLKEFQNCFQQWKRRLDRCNTWQMKFRPDNLDKCKIMSLPPLNPPSYTTTQPITTHLTEYTHTQIPRTPLDIRLETQHTHKEHN